LQFLFFSERNLTYYNSQILQSLEFLRSWLHCKAFSLNFFPTIHRFCRVFSVVEQELWLWVLQKPFFSGSASPTTIHTFISKTPPKMCRSLRLWGVWGFGE
jgi:hypothetical protein